MEKVPFAIVLLFVDLTMDFLVAGVVPGRWEKVEALEKGSEIIIYQQGGIRLECTFQGITEEQLIAAAPGQPEIRLPKTAIQRITGFQPVEDSKRNGTLIGAGIGFGAGFAGVVMVEKSKTASGYSFSGENVGFALGGGLVGCAVGAVLGNVIDGRQKAPEILYQAA